jgi:FAD dependent oxidoreductase
MKRSLQIPVLVLGGGTGGVAATLALADQGVRCIITEPTRWLGGQLTSQAVPPDENKWIEGIDGVTSATRNYLRFRQLIREHYKSQSALTDAATNDPHLNPGGGWVSRLCFDPRIGEQVIQDMLAAHIASGVVVPLMRHEPIDAETDGDAVTSVTLRDLDSDEQVVIEPKLILEATETGDLYPLADIEHHIGAEHRDDFGELHGRTDHADPMDQQAITWCFAMEHLPGENHVIDKPKAYDSWRSYVPELDTPWPGPLFSWDICGEKSKPRTLAMTPWPDEPVNGEWELWRYRRIVDRSIYKDPATALPDVSLFNCVQMDYFRKPLLGVSDAEKQVALQEAREQSLCLFYWMQTEAPRHDGDGTGYPGLKLRGDELGSEDGFAIAAYIREPRRLAARTMITEAHVGQEQRLAAGASRIRDDVPVAGEPFPDSVGIGHYPIDLHPSTAMRDSLYIPASPFRIPLGSLLPIRVRNVIAAGKAMGVTHIANGCTRLHPVEWNVGEVAGMLAAMCVQQSIEPVQVHENPAQLRDFQDRLTDYGVPLAWPWEEA